MNGSTYFVEHRRLHDTCECRPDTVESSNKDLQRVPIIHVLALAQLGQVGVERYESVSSAKIQGVVDAPVNLE